MQPLPTFPHIDTDTLKKAINGFVLCKLVQYPMRDGDGNIVADEYRQPNFSSLFPNTVMFLGKTTTRTTWMTGQRNEKEKVYSVSLLSYTDEDIRKAIDDGNVFVYLDKHDEDAPPLLIAEYKQLVDESRKAEVNETVPLQNVQTPISQGQQVTGG